MGQEAPAELQRLLRSVCILGLPPTTSEVYFTWDSLLDVYTHNGGVGGMLEEWRQLDDTIREETTNPRAGCATYSAATTEATHGFDTTTVGEAGYIWGRVPHAA